MSRQARTRELQCAPSATGVELVMAAFERMRRERLDGAAHEAGVAPVRDRVWQQALLAPVREILARPGKEFRRTLVELSYTLAGGKGSAPAALALAVEIIHAGSMIVDDIEDGSPERRGGPSLHRLYGVPLALNTGNWMYFLPFELLSLAELPPTAELELRRRMTRAMLDCHAGQALDLGARIGQLPQREVPSVVATATDLKTGALMQLAAELGALGAGAAAERVDALGRFGRRLGRGLQMMDDLGNLWGTRNSGKRHEDLRLGRPTWPWAWAAQSLDEISFAALETRARGVQREAVPCGPDAAPGTSQALEELAADLLAAVAMSRRGEVHDRLREALCALEAEVGASSVTGRLGQEIARVEAAYV